MKFGEFTNQLSESRSNRDEDDYFQKFKEEKANLMVKRNIPGSKESVMIGGLGSVAGGGSVFKIMNGSRGGSVAFGIKNSKDLKNLAKTFMDALKTYEKELLALEQEQLEAFKKLAAKGK